MTRATGRTAIEKIVARHAVGWVGDEPPRAGDAVVLRPRHVMTHDNTSAAIPKFRAIVGEDATVLDRTQLVIAIDHDIQNHTPENLAKYAKIRAFAERNGIDYHPPGRGIAHQVLVEEGYIRPGSLVVASDSHANMYGALGCLGTPVVRTDAAALWASGEMWWTVPPQVRVVLTGTLPPDASGKDVILALCSACDGLALNCCVEFDGPGLISLDIESRLSISNMSTEWGALAALFPCDDVARAWLRSRATNEPGSRWYRDDVERAISGWEHVASDAHASHAREIELDLSSVRPFVAGPNSVRTATPAHTLETKRLRIDKAYLMSCVNARTSDLEAAARVFAGGRRVAEHVRFYLAAASSRVMDDARRSGAWRTLVDAGAIVLPPGCGACIGLGEGTLEAGEVGISATNRNFEGRMGSRDAACYLASPTVVAESAIRGYIAAPCSAERIEANDSVRVVVRKGVHTHARPHQRMLCEGFPRRIGGRALILTQDNINTDAIYPAEATYRDGLSPDEQGAYAMRTYDPFFSEIVRIGDIIVAGHNFGCGSSREQAATALRARGIAMVIATSISQTYQRNAFNNGLIAIESADIMARVRETARDITVSRSVVGPHIEVNFEQGRITTPSGQASFNIPDQVAQELIVAGGLEAWALQRRGTLVIGAAQ
ncbi:MAG: aconitase family protein [Phycisphaerales bacterium]|jgi:homoaconitate hydratase|nr:aconitase family protein [Phycisphaerales bacterium]